MTTSIQPEAGSRVRAIAFALLVATALSLPFELESPLISLGPVVLTNLEIITAVFLAITGWGWLRGQLDHGHLARTLPALWRWLLAAFVVGAVLAALLAPKYGLNAGKAAARTLGGVSLALAVPLVVVKRRQAVILALALVGAGALSASTGIPEILQQHPDVGLEAFRPQPSRIGPFLRLSGTLDYANQMAMYLEATLPLLVGLVLVAWQRGRKNLTAAGGLLLIAYLQAGILTYSRALLITVVASFAVTGLVAWRRPDSSQPPRAGRLWIAVPLILLPLLAANAWFDPALKLRFTTQNEGEWYRAELRAPKSLELSAAHEQAVELELTNTSAFTWQSRGEQGFRLAARWYEPPDREAVVWEQRWQFSSPIEIGERTSRTVLLQAPPQPGSYLVEWDIVHENVTYFSYKTGDLSTSIVSVSGSTGAGDAVGELDRFQPRRNITTIPDRLTLWSIAGSMFKQNPWTGIGLDNFRLTYGDALDWQQWNTTIHSNNLYLETLTSLGILGALPFFVWLGSLLHQMGFAGFHFRLDWLTLSLATAILAFLIHGLVDYFLLFNATALLFWLLIGLWLAFRPRPSPSSSPR